MTTHAKETTDGRDVAHREAPDEPLEPARELRQFIDGAAYTSPRRRSYLLRCLEAIAAYPHGDPGAAQPGEGALARERMLRGYNVSNHEWRAFATAIRDLCESAHTGRICHDDETIALALRGAQALVDAPEASPPAPAPSSPRAEAPEAEPEDAAALWMAAYGAIEEHEARLCPEDMGCEEYIALLTRQRDDARAALRRAAPGAAPDVRPCGCRNGLPEVCDDCAGEPDANGGSATPAPTGERAGGEAEELLHRAHAALDTEGGNDELVAAIGEYLLAHAGRDGRGAAPRGTEGRDDAR